MKISPYDKLQALKRSEKYRADFQQYTKDREAAGEDDLYSFNQVVGEEFHHQLSEAGRVLCERWKIRFPVNPETPHLPGEESCVHAPVTYLDHPDRWKSTTARPSISGEVSRITHVDGKLVLMIDTESYSIDQIRAELEKVLPLWALSTASRAKGSKKVNIWEIYDRRRAGKSTGDLVKEIAAAETDPGLPVYATEAHIKLVQDALKKAERIITAVENKIGTVASIE